LTTISAIAPSIGNALAQLISGGSSGPLTPAATSTNSASSSATTSTGSLGPATFVTLSDQAKAAAATKAQSDQAAADNLQAYVDAHRVTGNGTGTQTTATSSLQNILDTSTQPTGTPAADAQSTTGSKVEAIVAQIKALADANEPPPFQPFTPTKSLSNSVTVDGYTLTLDTNASTQFYGVEVTGNGAQFYDKHFGPSDGGTGDTAALPPGVEIGDRVSLNNNEAIDAITITQNTATASSTSVSSSSAGSISTSSVNAQSSSITFLVNYATGQIGVEGSAASVSAQSTRVSSPGSTLSTLA
jgi:hypothetical protein